MVMIKPRSNRTSGSSTSPNLGGSAPPVSRGQANTAGWTHQATKYQDPTAPVAVAPTYGGYSSFDLGNLNVPSIVLGATAQGGSATLPMYADIVDLTEDITETLTGTSAAQTTFLFTNALDHFVIADATGATVWNQSGGTMQELTNIAFLSPSAGGSFGGTNAPLVATTAAQENVNMIAGLRLPAVRGPFKFTPTFNSAQGMGSTYATAATVALRLGGSYSSNVGNVVSYYAEQVVTLNSGTNYWNQFASVKNVKLAGVFISGINLSQVDEWYIENSGAVVEPLVTGLALQARQNAAFPGVTIPSNSLIYASPVAKTQWAINDSSQSRIHVTAAQTSIKIGYYWLVKAS